jgi:hypothetical protein
MGEGRGKAPAPNAEVFKGVNQKSGEEMVRLLSSGVTTMPDFSRIHPNWIGSAKPIDELNAEIANQADLKRDYDVDESMVRIATDRFAVADVKNSPIAGFPFTQIGIQSMARLLVDPKSDENIPTTLVNEVWNQQERAGRSDADNIIALKGMDYLASSFNLHLDRKDEKWQNKKNREIGDSRIMKVRTREIDGVKNIRMVASDRYMYIDNDLVMNMLYNSFNTLGKDMSKCFTSHTMHNGDDMHFNILVPDSLQTIQGDSDYSVGVAIKNSEVGRYRFVVAPFLFRWICFNGNIYGRIESEILVDQKHVGKTPNIAKLQGDTIKAISAGISQGHDLLTQMGYSRNWELPTVNSSDAGDALNESVARHILTISKQYHLTSADSASWFNGYKWEGGNTAHSLINGLSAAARDASGDDKWRLQEVSGSIISPNLNGSLNDNMLYWNSIGKDSFNERIISDEATQKLLVRVGVRN